MKSVGSLLKETRLKKKYSLAKVEEVTRIKKNFLEAIEDERWDELPAFPVVSGFVKSISKAIDLNESQSAALLRRDYPPKSVRLSPKPDVSDHFFWTPKLTFIVGVILFLTLILGYLGYEYLNFISPPRLEVTNPKDGQVITRPTYIVDGKTNSGSTVKVNNQQANVDEGGNFKSQIDISNDLKEVTIIATSRSGKTTTIHRTIKPELK